MSDAPDRIWLLPFDGEQRCWCDEPDPSGMGHEDEADEYIRADLVPAPIVTVKPLAWHDCTDGTSHDDDCQYEIVKDGGFMRLCRAVTGGGGYLMHTLDIEAAKAAAQADYEARIMAAVQIAPAQSVAIPEGHPDLNMAAWLDRRREQIGPWADYIIAEVGKLEQEIANLRSADPGWQDIRTAPMDGTEFLAYWQFGSSKIMRFTQVMEWDEYRNKFIITWDHDDEAVPTHWMPLPAPPSEVNP